MKHCRGAHPLAAPNWAESAFKFPDARLENAELSWEEAEERSAPAVAFKAFNWEVRALKSKPEVWSLLEVPVAAI